MYQFFVGCDEWQDVGEFETLEDASAYVNSWRDKGFTMGLYAGMDIVASSEMDAEQSHEPDQKERAGKLGCLS